MKHQVLIFSISILFFQCEKNGKEDNNLHSLIFDNGGVWYFSSLTINGVDSTLKYLGDIPASREALKLIFEKKGNQGDFTIESVDFVSQNHLNVGERTVMQGSSNNKGECTFVQRGIYNPFVLSAPNRTWNISYI